MELDLNAIYNKYDGKCAYCGELIGDAISIVGKTRGDISLSNSNPCCSDCFRIKDSITDEQLKHSIQREIDTFMSTPGVTILKNSGAFNIEDVKPDNMFYYETESGLDEWSDHMQAHFDSFEGEQEELELFEEL